MKKTILSFLLSVALLVYIMEVIGFGDIAEKLHSLDASVIASVFILTVAISFTDCFKWSLFLFKIRKINILKIVPIYFAGELFNALTPGAKSGGEVIKAHYVSKISGISHSRVYATILLDRSILLFVSFVCVLFSVIYTLLFLEIPLLVTDLFRVGIGVVVLLSLLIIIVREHIGRTKHETFFRLLSYVYNFWLFEFLRKRFVTYKAFENFVVKCFDEFMESLHVLVEHKKGVVLNLFFSLFIFFLVYFRIWVIFAGLGYEISIVSIIIVVTLGSFVSYFVLTPGGAGVSEIALISFYVAVGVDPHIGAIVALVDRGMYYIVSFGLGYAANVYMRFKV